MKRIIFLPFRRREMRDGLFRFARWPVRVHVSRFQASGEIHMGNRVMISCYGLEQWVFYCRLRETRLTQ